jgi:hypothetical protein
MKTGWTLCFILLGLCGTAQTSHLFYNDNVNLLRWQQTFNIHNDSLHTSTRYTVGPAIGLDSAGYMARQSPNTHLAPLFSIGAQGILDEGEFDHAGQALVGIALNQRIHPRLRLDAALYGGIAKDQRAERIGPATPNTLTGVGAYLSRTGTEGSILDINARLTYEASDIFTLEVGRSKHFFGNGYRSLFLSDNAGAYPYFKLKTRVWHLDYTNLFSAQRARLTPEGQLEAKYTSSHFLSWNISPRVNIHLFESIIWQSQDSLSNRGFDVYYLNPIIFYRPVEFALGSADNAIIGFGLDYKIYPSYLLYTEVVLDEFLLDQFRAADGWWANKFGVQVGLKGFDFFGIEGLTAQAEFNLVRPFTYSHGSPIQNYAHQDQALAHPLGANFYEGLLIGSYRKGEWEIRNHTSYTLKGDDEDDLNLGGDIFRSYVGPANNLGNFIGQGIQTEALQNSLYLSYILDNQSDMRISLAYHFRHDIGEVQRPAHIIGLSIQSNFGDGYR